VTVARAAAAGALALAVVLAVWLLLFKGDGGTEYTLIFQNAGQLVKDDDVQVGGRRIGSVRDIELTSDNRAAVKVVVQEPYAPLREGTQAIIRLTSLSGIANRYVAITPGPDASRTLPEYSTLTTASTTTPVDLDQLFNTLDPRTRRGLQQWFHGSAVQYEGQGRNVNLSARYFNPFLSTTDQLVKEIARDQRALEQAIVAGASVTGAVAQRAPELTSLITNLNGMMGAIASENGSLSQALAVLPDTLRQGNSTFVDLRATLDDLDPLLAASRPAAAVLPRFFREFTPLVNESVPTFQNLSAIVHRPGAFNDATDAVQHLPQLQRIGSPAFRSSITAMRRGQPVIDFLRPYSPDLVGWFRDFGQSAANYDANGHYARVMPIFGAFQYQASDQTLQPVPPSQRLAGLRSGFNRRCPGAASQPRPDGSNPYAPAGFDCDPTDVLPGP